MAEHESTESTAGCIAIIGMSGRFPGARTLEDFWRNLRGGVESISRFSPEELERPPGALGTRWEHPSLVPAGGVLDGIEGFDHGFFDIPLRDAQRMDPQQRLFLQCAWSALEDAGHVPERFAGRICLYAGAAPSGYLQKVLDGTSFEPATLFDAAVTANHEGLATRSSYTLRLTGESVMVHTTCSTGLVAVHLACQSLLLLQSDMAVAGATRIQVPQRTGYFYQEGMILSPDGHCRAFDARAQGMVGGNGVGVVVLKRLEDAMRDGDHVYAVIKGSAINNDGHHKSGFTAPSVQGQAAVIEQALAYAGVEPVGIGYVEAHGTGTPLGDTIEVAALLRAFGPGPREACALGSVKTNIGHLDTAAGIAGLIKAVLALHHEELPPSLHFERPNPRIDFGPFFVNASLRPWKRGPVPRRAGVSSFGIGGTNAHAVLEEAPPRRSSPSPRPGQLLLLSARTASALETATRELAQHLEASPGLDVADVAFTLAEGRQSFEHRRAVVAGSTAGLVERLRKPAASRVVEDVAAARLRRVAFLFPGQGAQAPGMGRELYAAEPTFRQQVDEALARLPSSLRDGVRTLLLAPPGQEQEAARLASATRHALPALFIMEHALARLWMSWGVRPHALLGHSYGEYVAACLAGVLSLDDGLRLVVARGELMSRLPPGAMLAVGLSEAQVQPLLSGGLSLAAVNAPERCVVSGPVAQVERLHEELKRREVGALRLPAAHAFHSADVEPLMPGLAQQVASLARSAPSVRYVSSLTGTWVRPEEAREPAYWAEQMRQPVRFAAGLETLLRDGCGLLLEVGPGQDLTALARACLGEEERERVRALPSLRRAGGSGPDSNVLLQSLGELWAHGLEVDWKSFYTHERRLRLPLPTYPFEEKRCWLEDASTPRPQAPLPAAVPTAAPVVALPLGEVEQRVAALWRERLGIEHVGRDDDFLGLGGNSLMAAQLLTQLRETFGVQLPLSDLFEAPTLAGLSARIEALLRAAQAAPSSSVPVPALVPLPRTGELPLSCVQERVWRLEQAFPGLSAYNLPLALRLEGALHLEALEHGLQEVVRRHELLRTTYTRVEGRPVQRVSSQAHVVLRRVELSGPRDAAEAEALRLAREDALAPFSLEDGPVLRTTLVRVAEDVHVLLVCFHHIVGDTLSILLFVRELGALYEAFRGGQPSPLPPMPVQYADFGAWQRRALAEGGLSGQQAWWRQQLAGMPRQLALPTDRPRPAVPQLTSVRKRVRFPSHLAGQVTAFGKREGATSFMVLLAAWQALLHRYSGQDDIVVATPIANRARPELQPLIGYVAHSLALRTDLSGDPSFQELLGRVREVTLGAQAHPDVPFEQLVEELHPERDIGRERMADSVFVVHAVESSAPLELPGLRLSSLELPEAPVQWGATLADLSVSLNEEPGQLEGFVEYAAELFEPERIERLLGHYQTLLEAALARPEERLSRLPLATGAELRALPWTELPPDSSLVRELRAARPARPSGTRGVAMSLSFFANDEDSLAGPKYELLLEAAKFADAHGFSAVWTPERHFHSFGGLYPQPAVVGAALAAVTRNLRIRAGSVVLPLHDPLLVAEQWSVVDNLSAGRVGVSFASGWHVHDFVFAPERYAERKAVMLREVETVRALWRGERVKRKGGDGAEVEVGLRPRPVQPELPIWLTAASNPETFRLAGELGAGVLTLLAAHDWAQLQEKVALYREAWRRHGHGPGRGHVTVLLHTFIGTDARRVRDLVRQPLLRYFRSSLDIMSSLLASQGFQGHIDRMTEADVEAMLVHGYELYVRQRGLIGTVEEAEERLRQAVDADVDEVAALIDFGLDTAVVLDGLKHLAEVRRRHEAGAAPWPEVEPSATGVEARVLDGAGQPVPVGVVGELALGVAAAASRSVSHPLRPSARLSLTGRRARLLAEGEVELLAPASAPSRSPTSSPVRPAPAPAIAPVSREEPLPLSFAQQRLWYLQQLEPGSAAYNNAAAFRLSGPLDADALQATLGEMVRRHEVLRTTYALTPRGAVQVIHPPGDVPLPRVGLEEATPEAREAELTRLCREEARQPFDLERGPVLRALLVRVQPEEHVLSLVLHHIVSDGWTAMVVARELVGLYGAFAAGRPSPLPPLAVQYADYAAWQRRVLEGPVLAEQLGWWKQQLAGVPALALPLDRPRPAVQSYAGSRHTFFLPKELSEALLALGRREGATPFMTMLALWQVFLHRYSGQEDFAVGAPIAGRERPETQALIGCFVNTLALRAPLSGRPSFREVLARVRQVALGAYAHQEVPFDRLVEVLQVPRDLGGTPVFQVMLNLNSAAEAGSTPSQVRVGVVEVPSDSAKFDLTLDVWEERDGLRCRLEYATALFEPDTVARMAANLARLARSAVEDPARAVGALELVEEEERRRVLVEWNDTRAPLPREACAHHLFEAQAARTPDAPAVAFGEDVFTYAELDRRANQLAHHLRSLGVDAESCVGLCLERSLDAVVAMLGILKAGGAFLPLDPSYPKARLAFLMEDAAIPLLVTRGEVLAAVPEGIRRVCLTADAQALAHQPGSPPATRADGDTLAYVIYTSGSTGRPKGTLLAHRGLCNTALASAKAHRLGPGRRVLQFASPGFDASVCEVFATLLEGACLVLAPREELLPGLPLRALLEKQAITTVTLTPSVLAQLSEQGLPKLETVVSAGEALPPVVARRWSQGRTLLNAYGPTEVTICCAISGPVDPARVTLGRAFSNVELYVLDGLGQPVPVGVAGELYVGGVGLARGYLGRPALTAERFIPHPFGTEPGARLYRTGDCVRLLPDGQLEFLHRADAQVKVRGVRIEPAEVEAALLQHPAVREAAVVAREDRPGHKRLVAYVTGEPQALGADALRAFLQERLPEALVPSTFVPLASLPLSSSGKLDREALPAPEGGRPELAKRYVAPRDEVERRLAEVWAEVLGLDRVGVEDNFFELGGDSILSLQVVARARRAGLEVTPKQFFQRQTVAELARQVRAVGQESAQGPVEGPVPLTPIQQRYLAQAWKRVHHFNHALLLELKQPVPAGVLEQALRAVVAHHDALRMRFTREADGWRQHNAGVEEGGQVGVERVDLSGVEEAGRARALEAAAARVQGSLDLERGPLLRVALFDLGAWGARLLVVVHHLVVDGVSWRVLVEDLERACEQLERGAAVELGRKTASYQQWARQLRAYAGREEVEAELAYWEAEGACEVPALPLDEAGGRNEMGRVRQVLVRLEAEETGLLLREVPEAYRARTDELLLAALVGALGRWSGQPRCRVTLEGHGREEEVGLDVSRTVGWFTSVYPVVLEAPREEGPGAGVRAVREALRQVPGKGLGYGVLRYLGREELQRRLGALPEAEVSFNYLGRVDGVTQAKRFALAREGSGPMQAEDELREHLLDVGAAVLGGRLEVTFSYGEGVHHRARVEALARHFEEALRRVMEERHAPEVRRLALSEPSGPLQVPPLRRVPRQGPLPLSFAQQRLWFLDQLTPDSPGYNMAFSFRLEGELDVRALERAFQEVVRRHEVLRTTFLSGPQGPVQVISEAAEVPLARVDLRALAPEVREKEVRRLEGQEARRPFQLARGPLVRTVLLWLREEEHQLLLTLHHIGADAWSLGVLVREVAALYGAYREARPSALPELALQYADFAAWQREWLRGETLEAHLAWWRHQLEGAPAELALPLDRPRPAVRGFRGATHRALLPEPLAQALESLARREGATLFMVLMAAFQALLHRYSGQTDVVVGTDVANRHHPGTEGLIGFFVNQLAVRLRLEGDPTFRQVLAQAKRVLLEAYAHQDLPFEELVRALNPERSTARPPLFQVKLGLQNVLTSGVELPGLKLGAEWVDPEVAKLDLTVLVSPGPGGLVCAWMYSQDLFDAATVARLARGFQQVLEAVVSGHGGQRLSALPILEAEERRRVLGEWSGAEAPVAAESILPWISAQAARVPAAVAVVAGDERLTYGELERRANQLAWHLRALGVGPEARVGLLLERSVHAVVGVLGILKAGGAYVPLEPAHAHASERLRYVLRDARVRVLVTRRPLASGLLTPGAPEVVCLDADGAALESRPSGAPVSGLAPGNLAYVIYTSGSTGQPKGVCIEHRQLASYVEGLRQRLALPPEASFASVSTLAADLGHTALFPPLCVGGTVHLVGRETASDAAALGAYVQRHGVEGLKVVPSHLDALLASPEAWRLVPRRWLVLGGEAVDWALVERVHALSPGCQVFNHYGPTETTVGVLAGPVARGGRVAGARTVPLGRPLGHVRAYVLDGYGQPVPPGVPGELYVGGASVGRGYLDRPELTAERFVPDALGGVPGARLYRTGDRVRWLADGSMEFLGRLDSQLKVRGYRVEPGEVTAVLRTHPAVRDCVVLGREEAGRQLVAYVVGREALEEAELREYLEQRLPEYMVPSAFVVLEALPLTPNGKVDGKALPAPARGEAEASFVAPRGETQQRLAGLWQELLAVERVGARDDFFALGGHSLLATRLMARIHDTFGAGLAVIDLFEAPTLERLAERIDTGTRSTSPLVALRKGGARPPFFCVHPVGGSVLCYLELARRLAPEQPFYGVQVPALEEGQAPDGTVEQMAARYVEALRGVQPRGPYLLGGWSFGGRVAYEMARRLTQQGEQVALLALIDAHGWGDSLEPDGGDAPEGQVLRFAEYLSRLSGVHGRAMEVLGQVDLQELRAVLEERPEAETGLPPESCEELRAVWRVFSRNLRASRQYVPQPFSGPLVLLRAGDVPAGDAGLAEDLGWAALAEGGVEVRQVPGDHYSLVTVPHVERLAEELQALLDRARAPEHGRQAL